MKTLYLMRHAEAEPINKQPDFKRNLTETGVQEAQAMADKMLKAGLRPDHMVSSQATRAYDTARIIAETLAFPVKNIEINRDIFENDPELLLDVIAGIEDRHASAMLVGHNPSITHLALQLNPQFTGGMHTAGLMVLQSTANSWAEFNHFDIDFLLYDYPRKPNE